MTDEKALLAAVCANPDEDTPRLMFADALEETGTPPNIDRAHFIRAQVELARLPEDDDDRDMCERRTLLERDAEQRRDRHPKTWGRRTLAIRDKALREAVSFGVGHVRGFPYYACVKPDKLLTLGDELFRFHPVAGVTVQQIADAALAELPSAPWIGRVRSLLLTGTGDTDWAKVFAAPELAGLTNLELLSGKIGPLAKGSTPQLRSLRRLEVGYWPQSPGRIPRLLAVLPPASLTSLELGPAWWTGDDLVRLAESPKLAKLDRLWMGPQTGTAANLRAFGKSPAWRRSRAADLSWASGKLAAELPSLPASSALRRVAFGGSRDTTAEEMRAIAASRFLRTVTRVHFYGAWAGAGTLRALLDSPHLGSLAELNMMYCDIGPEGAEMLADSPVSDGLVRLDLRSCRIKAAGAEALIRSNRFGRLRKLMVEGNNLPGGVKAKLRDRFGDAVEV